MHPCFPFFPVWATGFRISGCPLGTVGSPGGTTKSQPAGPPAPVQQAQVLLGVPTPLCESRASDKPLVSGLHFFICYC